MSALLAVGGVKGAAWFSRLRAAAVAVVLVSLAGCEVVLHANLTEQEANEIVGALAPEGMKAVKEQIGEKGWQVSVDEADLPAALVILRANELPGDRYVSMGDVFQKQGLVSTPSEERMRYIYSVSQELSYTLRKIDGVVAARVHVVIPINDPLTDKVKPSSAAVFIKHSPDVDLRLLVPAVKEFVAHSIEGLTHEGVSLSLFRAREGKGVASVAPSRQSGGGFGAMRSEAWIGLLALLGLGVAAIAILPGVLRKRGIDLPAWLRPRPVQTARARRTPSQ